MPTASFGHGDISLARPRPLYLSLLLLTILIGLASRHFAESLPALLAKNAGDVLYATMAYWLVGLLSPRLTVPRTAAAAMAFCAAIECAKFIQTPWLVAVRHRTWGHLIFGTGFHLSNLVCYGIGVLLGAVLEWALRRHWPKNDGVKARM